MRLTMRRRNWLGCARRPQAGGKAVEDLDRLTDEIVADVSSISPRITVALINEPLPVEHCPCCGTGLSRTVKPAIVRKLTDPAWATGSAACIYLNPTRPSLAIVLFLRSQGIFSGHLHLCQGRYLHYHCDYFDDGVPLDPCASVRTQATRIVNTVLREWQPAQTHIGTGHPDRPSPLPDLILPKVWEQERRDGKRLGPKQGRRCR